MLKNLPAIFEGKDNAYPIIQSRIFSPPFQTGQYLVFAVVATNTICIVRLIAVLHSEIFANRCTVALSVKTRCCCKLAEVIIAIRGLTNFAC